MQPISRRKFLHRTTLLGLSTLALSAAGYEPLLAQALSTPHFNFIADVDNATALELDHIVRIRMPILSGDGANVPIIISLEHPMEPEHYIKRLQIFNFDDPVISKGIYEFSPANGIAYLSTQIRLDESEDAEVFVVAECSQHGKWVASKSLKVTLGGC